MNGNFYRSPIESGPNTITTYSYWFDSNDKQKNTVEIPSPSGTLTLSPNINTGSLPSGTHTVHFQFRDTYGLLSAATNDTITIPKDTIPRIKNFSPVVGGAGSTVTIMGHNFTGADTVSFGGTPTSTFTVSSDSVIMATVGSGSSGDVAVTTPKGKGSLSGFTFRQLQAQAITFGVLASVTYGSGDISLIASTNSALPISYSSNDTTIAKIINGKVHIIKTGTVNITASQPGNTTYGPAQNVIQPLTINAANLTITAANKSKTYGSPNPPFTVTYTGFVNGDDSTKLSTLPATATAANTSSPAGQYIVTASGAAANNYIVNYVPGTLTVTPASLTIKVNNTSKITGQPNPIFTVSYSGFVNGDDSSKLTVLPTASTTATTSSPPGPYPIIANGAASSNYIFTYIPGTLTVNPIPAPTITSFTPEVTMTGDTVTITGTDFENANKVTFGGTPAQSFTVVSTTTIIAIVAAGSTGDVAVTTPAGMASLNGFTFQFTLPSTNFEILVGAATCRGAADGMFVIRATQNLNYTATVTGNGVNNSSNFNILDTIKNLTAGTYHLCITVQGQANYQQCYDLIVEQPKDLSVYSTTNDIDNTVTLLLNNGENYFIQLNGVTYTTSNNSITLPLKKGSNQLTVTTDKLCQGTYQTVFNLLRRIVPFPDPFDDVLSVNLGKEPVANALFEVHNTADGKVLYTKQMINQSGVVELDLSGLREGVYALYIKLDNIQRIYKIIKK
jgi:hypothetical protein